MDETITLPEFRTLVVLEGRGPLKSTALAELPAVNPATVSGMSDRLVAAGAGVEPEFPARGSPGGLPGGPAGRPAGHAQTPAKIRKIVVRMPEANRTRLVGVLWAFAEAGGEPVAHDD
ncbi:MarR family transcriptional regulator [Saccharothrix sp.]|uniref:MarR family transcriptional regulator n=1 Tax=Saccharothrix sp. TaxID=1873460 RepID=UPI002810A5A3|nr:MarR family transcriptional regulator [Saccharothrix sp.]